VIRSNLDDDLAGAKEAQRTARVRPQQGTYQVPANYVQRL
jgi:hypothetical protein